MNEILFLGKALYIRTPYDLPRFALDQRTRGALRVLNRFPNEVR